MTDDDLRDLEAAVLKRDVSTGERKTLASSGHALADGSYPIANTTDLHNAAILARSGHGNVTAAKRLIAKRASELGVPNPLVEKSRKAEHIENASRLWKADGNEQIIYGVVLEPDLYDSQGDIVSPDEIRKAAHKFMEDSQRMDIQHSEQDAPTTLLEHFLAPQDLEIGGEPVTKGSLVQAWRVNDAALWARVKDPNHPEPLTGFSMGGSAIRDPDPA